MLTASVSIRSRPRVLKSLFTFCGEAFSFLHEDYRIPSWQVFATDVWKMTVCPFIPSTSLALTNAFSSRLASLSDKVILKKKRMQEKCLFSSSFVCAFCVVVIF